MATQTKRDEEQPALVFEGVRWPRARGTAVNTPLDLHHDDGSKTTLPGTVAISVASGAGRTWSPLPNDAAWRNLAELRLDDPVATERLVRLRGDPYGTLKPGNPINTASLFYLQQALQLAAGAWAPPDATGTSHPATEPAYIRQARNFLQHVGAARVLAALAVIPKYGGLAMRPRELAGYLVVKAIADTAPFRPMRRCEVCDLWFTIIRTTRESRCCSPSCRAQSHRQHKEGLDGLVQEEHHGSGHATMASGVERAGERRHGSAKD
jgi:hypothetical protein